MRRAAIVRAAAAILAAALVATCGGPGPTSPSNLDPTGILLVGVGERVQSGPPNQAVGQAFDVAMRMAEAKGADLGYPFIDPTSGVLVVSAVTQRGRQLLEAANFTVAYRIRDVSHGTTELRRIQDDVTFLGARGVSDANLIFMTAPDHRDNRALIVISSMSRGLLDYLAAHYPPDALAVQVDPAFNGPTTGRATTMDRPARDRPAGVAW